MLSNVESKPTAAEAAAALSDAEATRAALARGIVTPSWLFSSIAVAIAVQIAATAVGFGIASPWLVIAAQVPFAAVSGVQLARFRRLNGVWLGGFASRVVLGTGTLAWVSYAAAVSAAVWAAYGSHWWLVGLCALAGGGAYALSGRRWMRTYRAEPAVHGRGESAAWLAALTLTAVACLALLLIYS
jgi:hypothetical protein